MNSATQIESLHPLETKVLLALARDTAPRRQDDMAKAAGLEPSQLSMAVEWLLAKALLRVDSEVVTPVASLSKVGQQYFDHYAPIERILSLAREATQAGRRLTLQDVQQREGLAPSETSGAIGTLKKEGAIRMLPGGQIEATGEPSRTAEALRSLLADLHHAPREVRSFPEPVRRVLEAHAVKRGNAQEPFRIDDRVERTYALTDTGAAAAAQIATTGIREDVSQLTPEMLKDGSWRTTRFRKYTISLRPPRIAAGKSHPYKEFLDLVKAKLVSMGFREMRGALVESEFWNMDALYMPQFHPARAIHDVYFVKDPSHARSLDQPFLDRVTATHRHGGETGSSGWNYAYDQEQARRLVLRSQGTAVSSRQLASQPLIPGKYFSIARCFRYDQVDATHATDFFQVEGIVLGADINFRVLLGLLNLFAREVAQAKESRFLPAYFPFTEPSVELHVRHPRLGWIELGGAGLFRPEVTQPLGVTVPVIAWGLGLDRMAMVALGIHDIRDLFSPDLDLVRTMRGQF